MAVYGTGGLIRANCNRTNAKDFHRTGPIRLIIDELSKLDCVCLLEREREREREEIIEAVGAPRYLSIDQSRIDLVFF